VALAGPSGVGKSSVVELLLRFRDYGGSITIGGTELRGLASDDLRRLMAVVPQRPHLFNTTIRDNILLAHPAATDEQLQRALADAALTEWVAKLPQGLETRVGEGGSAVSGGEARRIALARALVQDAPLLILDEPTEGLDLATERLVVARLDERLQGKTVLIVTHRPACLALAGSVVWLIPLPVVPAASI
jgi:ATP-binding cassette subfamily C protein CydC